MPSALLQHLPSEAPRRARRAGWFVLALAGLLLAPNYGRAQYYWDTNGNSTGTNTSSSETWSTGSVKNWTTNSSGTSNTRKWKNGNDAYFSAGTNGTGTFTVTVSGTVKPNAINVQEGTITFNGTSGGNIQFNDSTPDFTVATGLTTTVNTAYISGTNGVTKLGDGTLIFTGTANTYTGTTTVNGGTLQVNSSGQIVDTSDLVIGAAGTFQQNWGISEAVGALSGSGTLSMRTGSFTTTTSSNTTFSGTITDSYGQFHKAGSGTLTLSGNSTYSGITYIDGGAITAASNNALGSSTYGNVIANGASLNLQSNITLNESNFSLQGTGLGGNGAIRNLSGNNTLGASLSYGANTTIASDAGNLTLSAAQNFASVDVTFQGAGNINLSGQVYGSGALIKAGSGTVTLSGASANSYSGGTQVQNGTLVLAKSAGTNAMGGGTITVGDGVGFAGTATLQLGANNQIPDYAGTLTLNSDGVLDLNNFADSIDTIAGTGQINLGSSGQLSVGVNSGSSTFGGSITGTGTLEKLGSGILTFDSDINFTGSIFLAAGTINLNGFDLTAGTLHITGNSILDFGSAIDSTLDVTNLIIDAGVTLTIQNWVDGVDAFYAANFSGATYDTSGSNPMNQIVFSGFSANDSRWLSYDNQLTAAVPEPSTFGAFFVTLTLALSRLRRRHWRR